MSETSEFLLHSVLMGVGLAMDAFSVSVANGLNEPHMRKTKLFGIAGSLAFFQALMPMLGWLCLHTLMEAFSAFHSFVPWFALALLLFTGVKMLADGLRRRQDCEAPAVGFWALMLQGVATSIDAMSVGLTMADADWRLALAKSLIIAAVTLVICLAGLVVGKRLSGCLTGKASVLGGVILIAIGIEVFIKGISGG